MGLNALFVLKYNYIIETYILGGDQYDYLL